MKKYLMLFAMSTLLFVLVGCQKEELVQEQIDPIVTEEETIIVYLGNDNADGFIEEEGKMKELNEILILQLLIEKDALPENIEINEFKQEGKTLTIDFNQAFADYVSATGTAGEYIAMGSVVNTYLDAYDAESILITVNGNAVETGHNIYEEPLMKYENWN